MAIYSTMRIKTFLVCLIMACAFVGGCIIDADHLLAEVLGFKNGRFLHTPMAFIGALFIIVGVGYLVACWRGLVKMEFLNET